MTSTSSQDSPSRHTLCIRAIARVLNEGVALRVSRKCVMCARECESIIALHEGDRCFAECTREYDEFRASKTIPRFDLFISFMSGNILGIEMYVTHRTDPWDQNRNSYDWVEFGGDNIDAFHAQLDRACEDQAIRAIDVTDERRICRECATRADQQLAPIIVRQFGAGGGKTRSLFADIGTLIRSSDKRVFIFVSKTHSAIGTMQLESDVQLYEKKGDGTHDFDFADEDINAQKSAFSNMRKGVAKMSHSKTVITRHHATVTSMDGVTTRANVPFVCIFMTIDAMIYAIYNQMYDRAPLPVCADQFMERINRILDKAMANPRCVNLTRWLAALRVRKYELGDRCSDCEYLPIEYASLFDESRAHVFVDESQDLNARYAAVLGCLAHRGIGLTIVGDAMQAVYDTAWVESAKREQYARDVQIGHVMELDEHGHSRLLNCFPSIFARVDVEQKNITWRCRRAKWAGMINALSETARERASVKSARNPGAACVPQREPIIDVHVYYETSHENRPACLRDILAKYANTFPQCNQYELIMPFVKSTGSASQLTDIAQEFWESRAPSDAPASEMYVMHHVSVEGQPIQLSESENMMRIMSIHASKGTGREVIIWWDADDASLTHYDKTAHRSTTSLAISQCLRYVALTRHKRRLAVVCFQPSQILHDLMKLRGEKPYEKLVSLNVPKEDDELDITKMIKPITSRATFRHSAVVYPRTREIIARAWCDIDKPYHWSQIDDMFPKASTQDMTGIDMTDLTILRLLLSARCSFDCCMYGQRHRGGDATYYSISAICHQIGLSNRLMGYYKPAKYGETHDMWKEIDAIAKEQIKTRPKITQQLIIPAYTRSFTSLLTPSFCEGLRKFAQESYCSVTIEGRKLKSDPSNPTTYVTQVVNEETLSYLALLYFIQAQRGSGGYSVWSEYAITRTLRAIDAARASLTIKGTRCGDLSKLARGLIEPVTRQLMRIMRRDGRADIEVFENMYLLSRIYVREGINSYDYVCAKDTGFVAYDLTTKTFYLTLYEPKVTEINHIDLIAESLLILRCIYINSVAHDPDHGCARDDETKKQPTMLKWMTYIREAQTYAIRYIALNVSPTRDEIILIPDDEVTKIIRQQQCPFDEDIIHVFDDQITNIFTQIGVCASFLRGKSVEHKRESHKNMIARLMRKNDMNQYTMINSKICEFITKYDKEIFHAFMCISINELDEIRDKIMREINDIWRAQLQQYLTPCEDEVYIEEDEDEPLRARMNRPMPSPSHSPDPSSAQSAQ
ncbi:MAG: hypothetical protein WC919_02705 [Candidatus Paceibacterota bacterium]